MMEILYKSIISGVSSIFEIQKDRIDVLYKQNDNKEDNKQIEKMRLGIKKYQTYEKIVIDYKRVVKIKNIYQQQEKQIATKNQICRIIFIIKIIHKSVNAVNYISYIINIGQVIVFSTLHQKNHIKRLGDFFIIPSQQNLQSLAYQLEKMTQALKEKSDELNIYKEKAQNKEFQKKPQFEYEHELEVKELEVQTLKTQCQNLEKGYVDQHQKTQELQSQNWKLNNNVQLLQNDNHQLQANIQQLNIQIKQLQNLNQNLQRENQQIRQNRLQNDQARSPQSDYIEKNYKGLLQDKDNKIEDQKNKIKQINDLKEELTQNNERQREEIQELKKKINEQKLIGQELLKEEEQRVHTMLDQKYESFLNSQDVQIQQLKSENLKKNELLKESHYREQVLEQQIEELKKEENLKIEELRNKYEREKTQLQFAIRPNEHLEFKVDQLNRELESKVREINEKDGQINIFKQQIEQQIHQNVCLENENEVLKDRINNYGNKNDNNGDKIKIEYLKSQVEQLQKQLQQVQQEQDQPQRQPLVLPQQAQIPQFTNQQTPNQFYYQQQISQQKQQSATQQQSVYPQRQYRMPFQQQQNQNQNQIYSGSPDYQQNRKSGLSQNNPPRSSAQPYSHPDNYVNGQLPFSAKGATNDFLKTQRL